MNRTYSTALNAVMVVLGAIGSILWLGATFRSGETYYFWGIWLIVAAAGVYLVRYTLENGRDELLALVRKSLRSVVVPVMGIVVAILIGGVLMLITGYDPIAAYKALFYGGLVRNWHISVLNAAPLIFTALSVAFAFKAGSLPGAPGDHLDPAGLYLCGAPRGSLERGSRLPQGQDRGPRGYHYDDARPRSALSLAGIYPGQRRRSRHESPSLRDL